MKFARNVVALALVPASIWFGFFVLHATAVTILLAAVAALGAIFLATRTWMKNAYLMAFSAIFAIGIAEGALRVSGTAEDVTERWGRGREKIMSPQIFVGHEELGFDVSPSVTTHVTSRYRGRLIYEVDYALDADGARIAPPGRVGKKAVVLMGDSFHFGEGVNDNQTLGYFIQDKSDGRYWALNLARPAYGPHQTLRQLELDYPKKAGAESFDWMLLSVIDDHIERANGRYWWSTGPHYELDDNGTARLDGMFAFKPRPAWQGRLHGGSRLYVAIRRVWAQWTFAHDKSVFVGILRSIRENAERKYGGKVLVVYHPGSNFLNDIVGRRALMHSLFAEAGLDYIDVNASIAGIDESYFIETDGHPNEKLNAALSDVVLKKILESDKVTGGLQSLHQ